jgi:hypothetical protein
MHYFVHRILRGKTQSPPFLQQSESPLIQEKTEISLVSRHRFLRGQRSAKARPLFRTIQGLPNITRVSHQIRRETLPLFFAKVLACGTARSNARSSSPKRSVPSSEVPGFALFFSEQIRHFLYFEAPVVIVVTSRQQYFNSTPFHAKKLSKSFAYTLFSEHWSVCFCVMNVNFTPRINYIPPLSSFPADIREVLTDPDDNRRYGLGFVCAWATRLVGDLEAYAGFKMRTGFSPDVVMRLRRICERIRCSSMGGAVYEDGNWTLDTDSLPRLDSNLPSRFRTE